MTDKYWVSFSIGPVQSFVSTARTVRDLWTGSYLLSWLAAHGASCVHNLTGGEVDFLEPDTKGNPIFKFLFERKKGRPSNLEELLCPTIPNRFIVEMAVPQAMDIARQMEEAVREEWKQIAHSVRLFLKDKWDEQYRGWDEQWDAQIENCWDIRVSVLPISEHDAEYAKHLGFQPGAESGLDAALFKARMFLLARLDAAYKQVRHYPPHEPDDCHRPKCALCGERAQEIPQISGSEWEKATSDTDDRGERLRTKDRFCAVELVKRFAWAQYFSGKNCFDCGAEKRRVGDTSTIAASAWLAKALTGQVKGRESSEKLKEWLDLRAKEAHEVNVSWSGHWLSWRNQSPDLDDVDDCPDEVWKAILDLRKDSRTPGLAAYPPSFYAVLMLDGDEMGKRLRAADRDERKRISKKLATFAMKDVPDIVRNHLGQLIYAGGDDVLAMLPRENVLECAYALNQAFSDQLPNFTLSAGIAIVHVKHDLRNALEAARKAEKEAKNAGRKRLALSVVKRSGEPETAIITWDHVPELEKLRKQFTDPGVSDRWLYQLAAELGALEQDGRMLDIEFARLLHRSEKAPKREADAFWKCAIGSGNQCGTQADSALQERMNALMLMQHASFLARAKED
jgi:CRISPR-associated protein Cmr2